MKKIILILLPVVALFSVLFVLRTPESDAETMIEKYTNEHSQFAERDGLRVHYRDQGNPQGMPIVLLHGSSASLHTWEPMIKELDGDYRIITLSLPGHGLTGPHPKDDYSFDGMAEAIDLIADELNLDSFVLGGNSMGGWVSWRYALASPEKIDALILLDAFGMPLREGETPPPLNIGFRMQGHPVGRLLLMHFTPRSVVETSLLQTVSVKSTITQDVVDRYWDLVRFPGNRRAANFRATVDRELHMESEIKNITAPTLIIWGKDDTLIYASAAQSFDERLPNADVIIYEGVGHLPMEEAPKKTARDIDGFLDRVLIN